jgi:hypothetical protein
VGKIVNLTEGSSLMRFKPLILGLAVAALAVPAATLAKGKPPKQGPGCKPNVTVILKGKLTTDPGIGATSFNMDVTGANHHGKSLVTKPTATNVMITVDPNTKIRRNGKKSVDALMLGDRAVVRIMRCKADLPLTTGTVDDVAASRVTAHPPIKT